MGGKAYGKSSKGYKDRDEYANFGSRKGGKNGSKGKDGKRKGGKGSKEAPNPDKLDNELDAYFGKEPSKPVTSSEGKKKGEAKVEKSSAELDSQLDGYFGKTAEKEATTTKVDEKPAETKEPAAAETSKPEEK